MVWRGREGGSVYRDLKPSTDNEVSGGRAQEGTRRGGGWELAKSEAYGRAREG